MKRWCRDDGTSCCLFSLGSRMLRGISSSSESGDPLSFDVFLVSFFFRPVIRETLNMEGCSSPDTRSPIAPVDIDVTLEPPLAAIKDPTVGEEWVDAVAPTVPGAKLWAVVVGVESPTFRLIISLNRAVEDDSRKVSPVRGVLAPADCPPALDDDDGPIPDLLVTTDNGATPIPPYPKGIEYVMLAVVGVVDPVVVGLSRFRLTLLLVRIGGGGGRVGSKKSGIGFEGDILNAILGGSPTLVNGPSTEKMNASSVLVYWLRFLSEEDKRRNKTKKSYLHQGRNHFRRWLNDDFWCYRANHADSEVCEAV